MKIVSSGRGLNSREFYEKKKRKRRIRVVLLSVAFISVVSLFVYFFRQEQFLIVEVVLLGENVVDKEKIGQTAKRLLDGYHLWVIPRANTLFYPRRVTKQSLIEGFPRLKSVDLDLDEQQRLLITVNERIPFALYCRSTSECFFLDEEGFIFANAPSFSSGVYFIYTTEDSLENPVGERIVPIEEFEKLSEFIETLTVLNIYPVGLEVSRGEYRLLLPTGGKILWRRDTDLTLIYANLEAFLANDSIRAQSDFLDKISLLDLTTKNKIRWSFFKN